MQGTKGGGGVGGGGGGVTVSASTNIRHHMPSCPKFPTLENFSLIPTSMDLRDRAAQMMEPLFAQTSIDRAARSMHF